MTEYLNQYQAALHFYSTHTPLIMATPRNEWAGDAYAWDRWISMTPIEAWLWGDIRDANAVFYPQYPVGRFFVDFANPVAKVAIECDGKRFHQDWQKDAARQEEIEAMGWMVYRISGKQCMTDYDDEKREQGFARQFIDEIADRHGLRRNNSASVQHFHNHQIGFLERICRQNGIEFDDDASEKRQAEIAQLRSTEAHLVQLLEGERDQASRDILMAKYRKTQARRRTLSEIPA